MSAEGIYETICAFRAKSAPEVGLIDYCKNTLGGVEGAHFDFKEKTNAADAKLADADKKNFAKATSGFANGAGGVLIWGIEDGTLSPRPIANVAAFLEGLLVLAQHVTDPAVPGVTGEWIPSDADPDAGFAAVFIPESQLPPHRVILKISGIQNHYFMRSGTSFGICSHSQLEDMFGRRPKPRLTVDYEIGRSPDEGSVYVTLSITNSGRAIAKFPYLALDVSPPHELSKYGLDGNGQVGLPYTQKLISRPSPFVSAKFGSQDGFVIHSGVSHPVTKVVAYKGRGDLHVKYALAAEGLPASSSEIVIPASKL